MEITGTERNAGQSRREAYLRVLRREADAPVPHFFRLCRALVEKFHDKYGHTDYSAHYKIPLREVFLRPTRRDPAQIFERYWEGTTRKGVLTEWGILLEQSSVEHFSRMVGPLRNMGRVRDAQELPLPDFLADYRWEGVAAEIARQKEEGFITMPGIYGGDDTGGTDGNVAAYMDIFESAWYLRGLDRFLVDLVINEAFAKALLERVTVLKVELAKKWTAAGVDVLVTGDDVGTQTGLMMSAPMYRKWIKPRLKRVIDAAKSVNSDVLIFYHSDGNIEEIIPDLIAVGVEILNPIQPECMDPQKIIAQYGDSLSFWGTIGTQGVLPFGTADDVRDACEKVISAIRGRGGLVVAPTHLVEPEVPLENVEALVEAVFVYNGIK